MKKFITFAIAMIAVVSQAASINWAMQRTKGTYIWDSTGNAFSGNAYLILADDVASLTSSDFAGLVSGLATKAVDSHSITDGNYTLAETPASKDFLQENVGTYFQILFLDETNEKFYLSGLSEETAPYLPGEDETTVTFNKDHFSVAKTAEASEANWQSFGGGGDDPVGPAVPEPATGVLALAGLALLFRRRRA